LSEIVDASREWDEKGSAGRSVEDCSNCRRVRVDSPRGTIRIAVPCLRIRLAMGWSREKCVASNKVQVEAEIEKKSCKVLRLTMLRQAV
jgi:hypothetical protein